jgi:hypothetical protein
MMANASKKHVGPGTQGKGDGTGALSELPEGVLEENMVLSNRDKSRHSDERGLDSRTVQTEQYHDHAANRRNFEQSLGQQNNTRLEPLESEIRHRAYLLWEADGRAEGRDEDYWHRARELIEDEGESAYPPKQSRGHRT